MQPATRFDIIVDPQRPVPTMNTGGSMLAESTPDPVWLQSPDASSRPQGGVSKSEDV